MRHLVPGHPAGAACGGRAHRRLRTPARKPGAEDQRVELHRDRELRALTPVSVTSDTPSVTMSTFGCASAGYQLLLERLACIRIWRSRELERSSGSRTWRRRCARAIAASGAHRVLVPDEAAMPASRKAQKPKRPASCATWESLEQLRVERAVRAVWASAGSRAACAAARSASRRAAGSPGTNWTRSRRCPSRRRAACAGPRRAAMRRNERGPAKRSRPGKPKDSRRASTGRTRTRARPPRPAAASSERPAFLARRPHLIAEVTSVSRDGTRSSTP